MKGSRIGAHPHVPVIGSVSAIDALPGNEASPKLLDPGFLFGPAHERLPAQGIAAGGARRFPRIRRVAARAGNEAERIALDIPHAGALPEATVVDDA